MIDVKDFAVIIKKVAHNFHAVVPYNRAKEKVAVLDLSPANKLFTEENYRSTAALADFINAAKEKAGAEYLIGGYLETRNMYRRSGLFDKNIVAETEVAEEPRTLHLGIDIWSDDDTKIYAPLGGMVHSFAYNNNYGDYGATIILQHQLDTLNFYTLYGHLALKDIAKLRRGQFITRGENFAHFGTSAENGNWPPHLHLQVILDMGNMEGDYPGVCRQSEAAKYKSNSPDPDSILHMMQFTNR